MKLLIAALTFAFAATSLASDYKILKGANVSIEKYDESTKNFIVKVVTEPSVGPNYVTPQDLHRSAKMEGTLKDFLKNKENYIGSVMTLQSDLPLQPVPLATPKKSKKK